MVPALSWDHLVPHCYSATGQGAVPRPHGPMQSGVLPRGDRKPKRKKKKSALFQELISHNWPQLLLVWVLNTFLSVSYRCAC